MPCLSFGGRNAAARFHKSNWRRGDMAACCPRAAGSAYAAHRHPAVCEGGSGDRQPGLSALGSLGYIDGKTVTIEFRDADGQYERLQEAANELVRLKPDVIFSFGGEGSLRQKRDSRHSGRGRRKQ